MSDTLWHHEPQHARPPCPSVTPGIYPNSCPLSRWCHPTISSSVIPFSCLQSFPASGSFQMSQLFASGGQSVGVSASTSYAEFGYMLIFIFFIYLHPLFSYEYHALSRQLEELSAFSGNELPLFLFVWKSLYLISERTLYQVKYYLLAVFLLLECLLILYHPTLLSWKLPAENSANSVLGVPLYEIDFFSVLLL